ncbi:hypothetical protein HMPREF9412_3789 [Paenibacillus sp. HGF5]|nr:hypothetical protein HMPREF9412_3789 [Paenibacillus sp. HGF5]
MLTEKLSIYSILKSDVNKTRVPQKSAPLFHDPIIVPLTS